LDLGERSANTYVELQNGGIDNAEAICSARSRRLLRLWRAWQIGHTQSLTRGG